MYCNCFVADSEIVFLHVDYGYLFMQSGALHAERIGYLLGRHPHCDVDGEVRLLVLLLLCRSIVRHGYYDCMQIGSVKHRFYGKRIRESQRG